MEAIWQGGFDLIVVIRRNIPFSAVCVDRLLNSPGSCVALSAHEVGASLRLN